MKKLIIIFSVAIITTSLVAKSINLHANNSTLQEGPWAPDSRNTGYIYSGIYHKSLFWSDQNRIKLVGQDLNDTILDWSRNESVVINTTKLKNVEICNRRNTINNYNTSFTFNRKKTDIDNTETSEKPPVNQLKIAGELLVGTLSGNLTGFISSILMVKSIEDPGVYGVMAYAYLGYIIGQPIGSSIGVYSIGNLGNESGSFWYTLLGSIIGDISGVVLVKKFKSFVPIIVFSPIGATIGFNMSRQYEKSNKDATALLNYNKDKVGFNIPTTYYRYSPFYGGSITADILQINF